jgi:hypothetical protein
VIRLRLALLMLLVVGCGPGDTSRCADSLCPIQYAQLTCVDVSTDREHCGACGNACDQGQECEKGSCQLVCAEGEVNCDGECTLLGESKFNCGSCGKVCKPHESCQDGECVSTLPCEGPACQCQGHESFCFGACVDLEQNESHCGACRSPCLPTQTCEEGECRCPDGMLECYAGCISVTSNASNCGACGQICGNGKACNQGSCDCPTGLTDCDGTCVDLESSRYHCGECGNTCETNESCTQGVCVTDSAEGCDGPARFIDITQVALYQGVEVPLFSGPSPVPVPSRPVDIVAGRDALVRVFVEPLPSYVPRELAARFSVQNGAEERHFIRRFSPGDASTQGDLASTFNIFILGDALTNNTHFKVDLLDCSGAASGDVGDISLPVNSEWQPLVAGPSSTLQIAIVPIIHQGLIPDTSSSTIQTYRRELARQFPTVDITMSVTSPILSEETGERPDFDAILDRVTDKRLSDGVSDDVYYYGLINPAETLAEYCDGGCLLGLGWYLEDTSDFSRAHRTAMGIAFGSYGANTFAHELGHNLGRDHSPCATSGDQDYPHPGAVIGRWGYDSVGGVLKAPTEFRDVMSYCEPNWVSDYTYQGVLDRLRQSDSQMRVAGSVTSKSQTSEREWRAMRVSAKGARWVPGLILSGAPTSKPERGIVYDSAGEPIVVVEVYRVRIADGQGYKLLVPPEQPGWYAIGASGEVALAY